jgi:hypothetical protein
MSSVSVDYGYETLRKPKVNKNWEIFKWRCKNLITYRWREYPLELLLIICKFIAKIVPGFNVPAHGRLYLKKINKETGEVWDYGHVGVHLIVTAGKNYVAACFDNTNEPENLKYHGFGTGTNAANASDTGLQTELTTQYVSDNTRPTGSQAHSTNTYTTIATLSPDSGGTIAVTEWGLFSASSSTTLFDRQVFSAVNVVASADSLQTTYVLTLS